MRDTAGALEKVEERGYLFRESYYAKFSHIVDRDKGRPKGLCAVFKLVMYPLMREDHLPLAYLGEDGKMKGSQIINCKQLERRKRNIEKYDGIADETEKAIQEYQKRECN